MGNADQPDHSEKIFRDSIGQKATVDRQEAQSASAARMSQRLEDLGLAYASDPAWQLEHFKYRGSAAVHIYSNEILGAIQFMSQVKPLLMHRCPEGLAAKSFDDLLRSMKAAYGKSHGKLRSGF